MKIEWTEPAVADLQGIKEYISRDSQFYANRFIGKIIDAVESLENFPNRGRIVPEADDETIRELLFQPYRIIYKVIENKVTVLSVIHGGRDLSKKETKPWEVV